MGYNTEGHTVTELLPPLQFCPPMPPLFLTSLSASFVLLCCRRRKAGILPSLEDLLFYTIAEGQEKIPAHKFTTVSPSEQEVLYNSTKGASLCGSGRGVSPWLNYEPCSFIDLLSGRLDHDVALLLSPQALKATGLRTGDPRLKECMEMLKVTLKTTSDGALDRHLFKK